MSTSKAAADLVKGVYKDLGIQFTVDQYRVSPYKACPKKSGVEAVMIDPSLAGQSEIAVLVPSIEAGASDIKKEFIL